MVFVVGITLLFSSCNSGSGHLLGVQGRKVFFPEIPLGMIYIPSGSYTMGASDEDVPFLHQSRAHVVSIHSLYMDQTEITNNEYREFVEWVKDSIMLERVYENTNPTGNNEIDEELIGDMLNHPDIYYDETNLEWKEFDPAQPYENRELFAFSWKVRGIKDEQIIPLISDMYLRPNERFYKRREIDTRKLKFRYYWINLRAAAQQGRVNIVRDGYDADANYTQPSLDPQHRDLKNPPNAFTGEPEGQDLDLGHFNKIGQNNALRSHEDRSRFIIDEVINVYPDTLCWVRDFTYSFNDPMTNMYFWHPAYDEYPVVNISRKGAELYCEWLTIEANKILKETNKPLMNDLRIPVDLEWAYAASSRKNQPKYANGNEYLRDSKGKYEMNYMCYSKEQCRYDSIKKLHVPKKEIVDLKSKEENPGFVADGAFHTSTVKGYNPNSYGLYGMAGNVSEMVNTFDKKTMKYLRIGTKGGSWFSCDYFLEIDADDEYPDEVEASPLIGFRPVFTAPKVSK